MLLLPHEHTLQIFVETKIYLAVVFCYTVDLTPVSFRFPLVYDLLANLAADHAPSEQYHMLHTSL